MCHNLATMNSFKSRTVPFKTTQTIISRIKKRLYHTDIIYVYTSAVQLSNKMYIDRHLYCKSFLIDTFAWEKD